MKHSILIIVLLCLSLMVCSCGNSNNIESDQIDQYNQMSNNEQNGDIEASHGGERPLLTVESVKEYKNFINSKKLPDNFVTYEIINQLGAFESLVILSDSRLNDYSSYFYNLVDSSGFKLGLYVDHFPEDDYQYSLETVTNINANDMRTISEKVRGEFTTDGITYTYISGELLSISWINNGITYTLCGESMLSDYPTTQSTVVGKMLNTNYVAQTIEENFTTVDK